MGMVLMGLPLVVWVVEHANRRCGSKARGDLACTMAKCDATTTHLVLECGGAVICTEPGDYCFLTIPAVSGTARHPFSICSQPGSNKLEFRIKNMGNDTFTGKLYQHVQQEANQHPEDFKIAVTGPYGRLSVNLRNEKYDTVVLVAGGIGVTPMMSTLHWLYDMKQTNQKLTHVKKVIFIWTVRFEKELNWCTDIVAKISSAPMVFSTDFYVTRPNGDRARGTTEGGIEMTNVSFNQVAPANNEWVEHIDESTQKPYYHNTVTDETVWCVFFFCRGVLFCVLFCVLFVLLGLTIGLFVCVYFFIVFISGNVLRRCKIRLVNCRT